MKRSNTDLRILSELLILKKQAEDGNSITSDKLGQLVESYGLKRSKPTEDVKKINNLWADLKTLTDEDGNFLLSIPTSDENFILKGGNGYTLSPTALKVLSPQRQDVNLETLVKFARGNYLPVKLSNTRVIYDEKSMKFKRVKTSEKPVNVYPLHLVISDGKEYLLAFNRYIFMRDMAQQTKAHDLWGLVAYRKDRIDIDLSEMRVSLSEQANISNPIFLDEERRVYGGAFWDAVTSDEEQKLEETTKNVNYLKEKHPEEFKALLQITETTADTLAAQMTGEIEEAYRKAANRSKASIDIEQWFQNDATFGMYSSPLVPATMYVRDTAFNGFYDRFGSQFRRDGSAAVKDMPHQKLSPEEVVEEKLWRGGESDEGHTWVKVPVKVRSGASFYGWLLQFDGQIVLEGNEVLPDFKKYLANIAKAYGD